MIAAAPAESIPEFGACEEEVMGRLLSGRLAVFLDYDGTLTPIVASHEQAVLDPEIRALVHELSELCTVGIVSGRDLEDVRRRVGLDSVWLAGSHGFDLAGPGGWREEVEAGREAAPLLNAAEAELREALASIPGAALERKRFSLAVHYRNAAPQDAPAVEAAVDAALNGREGLRKGFGKKVFELQPRAEWNKGEALMRLLEQLGLDGPETVALHVGDDVTDEDAFRVMREHRRGLGILVRDGEGPESWADARLKDPDDVARFLRLLIRRLRLGAFHTSASS